MIKNSEACKQKYCTYLIESHETHENNKWNKPINIFPGFILHEYESYFYTRIEQTW